MTQNGEGRWHLFFSRWPLSAGFEAWVTHSEVCHAVSEQALGPYIFQGVIFKKRKSHWDGDVTHNPQLLTFRDRFFLFYNGNQGNGEWWDHRNHQRVGVSVSEKLQGPWTRFDQPVLDVTTGAWDAKVTTNPTACVTPEGKIILIYKGVGGQGAPPFFGPVKHGVAFSEAPDQPFTKHPVPIFEQDGATFSGEDPFIWCQSGRYYALLKDMGRFYSDQSRAIVLFESSEGTNWSLAKHPVVHTRTLVQEDGSQREVFRLERPSLFLQNGQPSIFCCAVKPTEREEYSEIILQSCRVE